MASLHKELCLVGKEGLAASLLKSKLKGKSKSLNLHCHGCYFEDINEPFRYSNLSIQEGEHISMAEKTDNTLVSESGSFISYTGFPDPIIKSEINIEKLLINENTTDYESATSVDNLPVKSIESLINLQMTLMEETLTEKEKPPNYQEKTPTSQRLETSFISGSENSAHSRRLGKVNRASFQKNIEVVLSNAAYSNDGRYLKRSSQMKRRKEMLTANLESKAKLNFDDCKSIDCDNNSIIEQVKNNNYIDQDEEPDRIDEKSSNFCSKKHSKNTMVLLTSFNDNTLASESKNQKNLLDDYKASRRGNATLISLNYNKDSNINSQNEEHKDDFELRLNLSDLEINNTTKIEKTKTPNKNAAIIEKNKALNNSNGFFKPTNKLIPKQQTSINFTESYLMALGLDIYSESSSIKEIGDKLSSIIESLNESMTNSTQSFSNLNQLAAHRKCFSQGFNTRSANLLLMWEGEIEYK